MHPRAKPASTCHQQVLLLKLHTPSPTTGQDPQAKPPCWTFLREPQSHNGATSWGGRGGSQAVLSPAGCQPGKNPFSEIRFVHLQKWGSLASLAESLRDAEKKSEMPLPTWRALEAQVYWFPSRSSISVMSPTEQDKKTFHWQLHSKEVSPATGL